MSVPDVEQSAKEVVAYVEGSVGTTTGNSYIGRVVGYMRAWPIEASMNIGLKRQHSLAYIIYTEANILSTASTLPGYRATINDEARGVAAGSEVVLASSPVVLTFSNPVTPVTIEAPRTIRFRARSTTFDAVLHFDLLEGSSLVTDFSQQVSTTWTTYTIELPSYLTASITDYNNVVLSMSVIADPGIKVQVSWIEMEVPGAASGTERTIEDGTARHVETGHARTLET